MPFQTDTIDIDAERGRLAEEMDDVAEQQAAFDDQSAMRAQQLQARGFQLGRYRDVLEWARDEWGVETIEVAGLSTGELARVNDLVDDHGVPENVAYLAVATQDPDLPYMCHTPEQATQDTIGAENALLDTVARIQDGATPIAFVRWAEERINDLTHPGGEEGNSYLSVVSEKRREKTSTETSG